MITEKMGNRVQKVSGEVQRKLGYLTSLLTETISGISVIRGFSLEKYAVNFFARENEIILSKSIKNIKVKSVTGMIVGLINSGCKIG